ncbi:MAG: hypothetical protein H0T69_01180 [Thermoleophilaceae bacterium]|nr:hypothetical protein [Thermoleophilaceae bacterium]
MARAQSPIKVHESTKQKVRYAALMAGLQQAELVEIAVDEYVERHREEFGRRMERAREALLGGKASALAYATGVSEEDVERVGGVSAQSGSRKPSRATSNQASSPEGQSARGSQSSARAASKTSRKSTSRRRSSTKRPSAA